MATETVSIIVPVYNVVQWIGECVESLVKQTYSNLEILLVDDGSSDGSAQICDCWAQKDERIRVIHKANGGAASARNTGMDQASGDYWCFIDGDDIVDACFVERLMNALIQQNADMAVCGFVYWTKSSKTDCLCTSDPGVYSKEEYLLQFLKDWTCSPLTNKVFRRETVGDIRMEEGHRIDDEFFTYQVVINCRSVVVVDECLYYYRLRGSSVMQELDEAKEKVMLDRVEYVTTRYRKIAQYVPAVEEAFFFDAIDTMTRYWYHSLRMPIAQKQIRAWALKHIGRLLRADIPLKQKGAYLMSLLFKTPQVNGEGAPIEEEKEELFD